MAQSPPSNTPSIPETLKCKVLSPIRRSRQDRLTVGQEIDLKPEEVLEFVELDPPAIEVLPLPTKVNLNAAEAQEIGLKLGARRAIAQNIIDLRNSLGGKISSFDQIKGIWQLDISKVIERAELK